ncbi:MAG: hypothetical protein V1661_02480 [bacterium]
MTKSARHCLWCVVRLAVKDHDARLLERFVKIESDPEVKAAYQEAHRIYAKDPDVLVLYFESKDMLEEGNFKSDAEKEALQALFAVAKEEVDRAEELAKKVK